MRKSIRHFVRRRMENATSYLRFRVHHCNITRYHCSSALAQYQLTNLVSNQSGQALHQDPLLINAWGLVHGPGGPWWISDDGSGWSTLYNSTAVARALQVVVPAAKSGATGSPTGIVFNGSQQFRVRGWPSTFLFATLDGTISGWAPQSNPNP